MRRSLLRPDSRQLAAAAVAAVLLTFNALHPALAQGPDGPIKITGADDTMSKSLEEPSALFRTLGLSPEEVQALYRPRIRVQVTDAGAVSLREAAAFLDTPGVESPIAIQNAGSARSMSMDAMPPVTAQTRSNQQVLVINAGSVRELRVKDPNLPPD